MQQTTSFTNKSLAALAFALAAFPTYVLAAATSPLVDGGAIVTSCQVLLTQPTVALVPGSDIYRNTQCTNLGAQKTSLVTAPTDVSGTIVAGGTSQALSPANQFRQGYSIQNESVGALWVNDTGAVAAAAPPNWQIPAGATFTTSPNYGATSALSIWGATTGQAFSARTW